MIKSGRSSSIVRGDKLEIDQIDVCTTAVLCHLEEVHHSLEARLPRQLPGDVGDADLPDGLDKDVPVFHRIDAPNLDAGTVPDPDRFGDPAFTNSFPKVFGEHHDVTATVIMGSASISGDARSMRMHVDQELAQDHRQPAQQRERERSQPCKFQAIH